MFYIHIAEDGTETYPYTVTDFRRANPNISICNQPEPKAMAEHGMFPVEPAPEPAVNDSKIATRGVQQVDGVWRETWTVTNATAGIVTQRLAGRKQEKWEHVKSRRDVIIDASFGVKTAAANTRALELGAAIAAASDRAALQAIDMTVGWP